MYQILKNFLSKKLQKHPSIDEDLRIEFKARYHNFRLLLNANKSVLEAMARIEQALRDQHPFGMPFVRANCTTVSVEVLRMIKNLERLAPGKYQGLHTRFDDIQQSIDAILTHKRSLRDRRFVILLSSIYRGMADLVGTKMANLGEIKNKFDVAVPDGFAITSAAHHRFIEHNDLQVEIDRRFQAISGNDLGELHRLSDEVQQLIVRSEIPADLRDAIMEAYLRLKGGQSGEIRVALRSSALGEDTKGKTFAGQYLSELNVGEGNLIQAYKKIVASKYSLPAITYRMNRGLKDDDFAMCVGCMVMIDAESGGVTYSGNPLDFRDDSIYINAVWGLPKPVVDGSVAADLFSLSRKKPISLISQDIKSKETRFSCLSPDGQCGGIVISKEKRDLPSITQQQAILLAELAVIMPLVLAVCAWLLWRGDRRHANYWLAAGTFAVAAGPLIKVLLQVPRPDIGLNGLSPWAFPSSHTLRATVVYGFLAVSLAGSMTQNWRWLPYVWATVATLAVETGIWPLKEAVQGQVRHTYIPNHFRPVAEYLEPQRRFRHLFKPLRQDSLLEQIQANVDAYWHDVETKESQNVSKTAH